jgi:hypothetical protein
VTELYAWFAVVFLSGMVIGLAFPRLCPRCKMEKTWITKVLKEFKKGHDDKPSDPSA